MNSYLIIIFLRYIINYKIKEYKNYLNIL